MKQYVLSTIIGTGSEYDAFRPVVADYPCNWGMAIAPDQQTNASKHWVLCVVAAVESVFTQMGTNAGITLLPFGPAQLDLVWLSIGTTADRNKFASAITSRTGVAVTRDDPRTLRAIMTEIGRQLSTGFNPDNLDVPE